MKLINIKINNTGLLILFLSFIACSDKPENDLSNFNLKGKVKSFSQESYEVKVRKENIIKGRKIDGFNEPDAPFSPSSFRIHFKFDENGNTIETNNVNSKGKLHDKSIYKYNDKGNLFESSTLYKENETTKQIYNYNTKGKLIGINYFRNEKFFMEDYYQYDDKGNLIDYSSWTVDPKKLQWQTHFKYNEQGNLIEKEHNRSENDSYVETFKYDDRGNIIIKKGGLDEKTTYVYDEKNNVIQKTYYNEKDEIQRSLNFEYEYDNNDNWTKRVAFILDKPGAISIREYEYY